MESRHQAAIEKAVQSDMSIQEQTVCHERAQKPVLPVHDRDAAERWESRPPRQQIPGEWFFGNDVVDAAG